MRRNKTGTVLVFQVQIQLSEKQSIHAEELRLTIKIFNIISVMN